MNKIHQIKFSSLLIIIGLAIGAYITFGILTKTNIVNKTKAYSTILITCGNILDHDKQIDCVYRVMQKEMQRTNSVKVGIDILSKIKKMEVFKESIKNTERCHGFMHRIGDWAYYNLYRGLEKNISDIDFPQLTTICGYGFFHGFIEHLIQDNSDPVFFNNICELLKNRFGYSMKKISKACYHGIGHGFILAQADKISKEHWGDLNKFVDEPVLRCANLPSANQSEIETCWRGIFSTVAVFWTRNQEYGFSYDPYILFEQCNMLQSRANDICHIVFTLEFEIPDPKDNPASFEDVFINLSVDEDLTKESFVGPISEIIARNTKSGKYKYRETLAQCESLNELFYKLCISGIARGLIVYEAPGEHKEALSFCSEKIIEQRGLENFCYEKIIKYASLVYSVSDVNSICKRFPSHIREEC